MNRSPLFVSIIVPTYMREVMLRETLASALALDYSRFEILVYDQSPSHEPETEKFLQQFAQRENCFVFRDRTASLPRARNAAFLRARGEIILFIDDDVLLPGDFIQRHLKPFEDETIAAVSGRILYPG
ncbi:MAG: glycosyltransferase family 2 protein, partial [Candidatus Sumerlaeota bacterium]